MSGIEVAGNVETWSGKDRGDENFPVGSRLIRADLRPHVHAYYAFARNADDIADSAALSPKDKVHRLDIMQAVLVGDRVHGSPSATALRASLAATGVDPAHATDLLVAFRQDATQRTYADWDALMAYCRVSAMPVGRYVLDLHGEDRATHAPSDALCAALQVLNHLQDCAKDFIDLDRCYLPADLRRQFDVPADALRQDQASAGLRRVLDALLDRVDALNREAALLPRLVRCRGLRLETAVICGLARRLAAKLRRGDPIAGRVALGKADAAMAFMAAWRFLP